VTVETVGILPSGVTLVRLIPASDENEPGHEDDVECPSGSPALRNSSGQIFHTYPDRVGRLELLEGPYGQVALIERCEESLDGIMLVTTGGLSSGAVPPLVAWAWPDEIGAITELGWLGLTGFFSAEATYHGHGSDQGGHSSAGGSVQWTDTIVIDAVDGSTRSWAEVFGQRLVHPLDGLDVVVPDGWTGVNVDDVHTSIVLSDSQSQSWVTIDVFLDEPPTPAPTAGETALAASEAQVHRWDQVDDDRSVVIGQMTAEEHRFTSPDGDRMVRLVRPDGQEGRRVRIEAFTDAGSNLAAGDVPLLVVESVRIHNTVG
jgi:hypothetical protein